MICAHHAKYFACELTKRCSSDSLQKLAVSLADAQVELNPHQIDAALFAFRSPLSKGAILADEVGLGKTIEAGILLSQKWAERKRSLLVIVPANLRKQWHQELADKFFLPATILETRSFNEQVKKKGNLNPFVQTDSIVICSYQFARAKETYVQKVRWDLVVIDEAHRLRNVYKSSNRIANSIKNAVAEAPKILLTATPLQNSLLELYGLVSVIDDYTFGDLKSFKNQFLNLSGDAEFEELKTRLKPICQRTLRRQVLEYVPFTNRYALVQEFYPSEEEQRLYDLVSDYLQRPALFALPASQRKLMTLILRKLLASSTYAISGTLEALAGKLETITKEQSAPTAQPEDLASDFETVDEIKDEWDAENGESPEKEKRQYTPEEMAQLQSELDSLRTFHKLASSIGKNSKGENLLTALKRGFEEAQKKGAQKKALIFTESTRTQIYLREILEKTEYTGKIVLFNGSNIDPKSKEIYRAWLKKHEGTDRITGSPTADMRAALVDCFRDEAEIMIATEAAAEGINLQFCSLVVNYDLPWNPQRIEQRIGRCHRYAQNCDLVLVKFLKNKNAADQRVYELLDEKFKLFSGVFGASDEVLGSIESGVDFEKRIADIYQECRTPQQIEFNFNQLQAELENQIDDRIRQTREKLLENFDEEVSEKLRFRKQENADFLGKYDTWLWEITNFYLRDYARFENQASDTELKSFFLDKNPFPGEEIHPGPYRVGRNVEDVNRYRLRHPLAQKIIQKCLELETPDSELVFNYTAPQRKIAALESLVGKSGFLRLTRLTITAFDTEDRLIFSAMTDDGKPLEETQCQRLFSLAGGEPVPLATVDAKFLAQLDQLFEAEKKRILNELTEKNANLFSLELDKMDRWGEDLRNSLKAKLQEFDEEIKNATKQARLAPNLPDKLKHQHTRKDLETKRDAAWRDYDRAAKEVEARKDRLMDEIEKKLEQQLAEQPLFTLRWKII
jgi:superfamily II DNA or RNA helicase